MRKPNVCPLSVLFALLTCWILSAACALPAGAQQLNLSAGHLRLSVTRDNGMRLLLDGVPVIRESNLYIVKPGWTGHYLDHDLMTFTTTSDTSGAVKTGTAIYESKNAVANYRFEVRPDDTFTVTVHYRSKVDGPTEIEYDAGYLNANLLQGRPFVAETVDGHREGIAPLIATTPDQKQSEVVPNLTWIRFDTVLGEMEIQVKSDDKDVSALRLFDSRAGQQDWARANPMFWFGIGDSDIPKEGQTVTVTYRFKVRSRPAAPATAATPKVTPLPAAARPFVPDLPVIPRPKEMKNTGKPLDLSRGVCIVIPDAPGQEEKKAARELQADFKAIWAIPAAIARAGSPRPAGVPIVLKRGPDAPRRAEGYRLSATGNRIAVIGRDGRGVYNGAQTLRQLVRVDLQGRVTLKAASIRDWPSLGMRGVHWFGGPESWPFHRDMIARVLSPLKMNTMLYECSFTEWDSQPKLHGTIYSTSKADVRKTVNQARAHFIEPIPLVETLGHMEWMFQNDQNKDLAADPNRAYAYDPDKSRVYTDILFPVMEETVELFKPRIFHLGRDEVKMWAKFPPEGSAKSTAQFFLEDLDRLNGWLKARGIRAMMWGDQLLHYPDDTTDAGWAESVEMAQQLRREVPKDILINDWHYTPNTPDFPSVSLLKKAGFRVVGSTWFEPANIQNFTRALNKEGAGGLIQTTWTGWRAGPYLLDSGAFVQLVAYLLAAEYAWNGGQPNLAELGYSPDEAFRAFWSRGKVDRRLRPGFTVDFSTAADSALWAWTRDPEKGTALPKGQTLWAGTTFDTTGAIRLAGVFEESPRPREVTIPLNGQTASSLQFLWATTWTAERGSEVLTLRVEYADGQTEKRPIIYGREIHSFADARGGPYTITAWRGRNPMGQPVSARRWTWDNPRPDTPITRLVLTSANGEGAPVLLGLTGIR